MTAPSEARPRRTVLHWGPLRLPWWAGALGDAFSLAARRMWRNRGVTALVVVSLAVGIGANTAVFSIVDAAFLAPLPISDPATLGILATKDPAKHDLWGISIPNVRDVRGKAKSFKEVTIYTGQRMNVGAPGSVVEVSGEIVSANYFQTLGLKPYFGRLFEPEQVKQPGGERVAVISHAFWRRHFGSDPGAIGRKLAVNGKDLEITGVAPPEFRGLEKLDDIDVWAPFENFSFLLERPSWVDARRALIAMSFVRLKPGVTMDQATAEVDQIGRQLAEEYPLANAGRTFRVTPLRETSQGAGAHPIMMKAALILLCAAGVVLLIAIANAGNVLLARATGRRREMAVRLAMGATRRHIISQILIESALLVIIGGGLGLALGMAGREVIWSLRPERLAASELGLALNPRVLAFAAALSFLTGILANLMPALQTLRGDLTRDLRERTDGLAAIARRLHLRQGLVIGQVALSLIAMVGAELCLRSLRNARQSDPGFDTRTLAIVDVNPRRLGMQPMQALRFYMDLQSRLAKLPDVKSVAVASDPVFGHRRLARTTRFDKPDSTGVAEVLHTTSVTPGYFETTENLLLRGRAFTEEDRISSKLVAIVNEAMVRRYFPGSNGLGKQLHLFGDREMRTIVGVARDTSYEEAGMNGPPLVYVPMWQDPSPAAAVHVRTAGNPAQAASRIAAAIGEFEPRLPAPKVQTSDELLEEGLWAPRISACLLAAFGFMAMVLAAVGVYGITAHAVSQRTGEIGVRMAMGACPVDVVNLVWRQAVTLVLPGMAIGCAVSFGIAKYFQPLLNGVSEMDLEPYLAASILLAAAALLASYLPARRALKMQPMVALRQE